MDSNAMLEEIREIIADYLEGYKSERSVIRLVYLIAKLDRDICKYGQIPDYWLKGQRVADGLED